ncbi:MAG: ABC transporter permease [Acidobacteriota bacterium]|jgi:ABC-type polysaccharide/polyol phosphate export permease
MHYGLRNLLRHRVLIQSLVVRELKARYRGSVGGYLWSFLNPLLLLAVYTIVFTVIIPQRATEETKPYALYLFCGLLPWTWFSASLIEASNSLIAGGNLIKKLIFPAEVLPVVSVLANMVHYLLGLPIYLVFWIIFKPEGVGFHALWLPVVILTQLILSLGLGLILAALTVHFRDIRDILANVLTLWFFLTPIIYTRSFLLGLAEGPDAGWIPKAVAAVLDLNPMTHIMDGYHLSIFEGTLINWKRLPVTLVVSLIVLWVGYWFFDRLRDSFPEEV